MGGILGGLLGGVGTTISNVEDFFSTLLNPHTYVRLFFVVLGFALIYGAVVYGR